MTKTWRAIATACAGALLAPMAQAAFIGTGPFNAAPHIIGVVKPGEADEVARTFTATLKLPLALSLSPLSDARELARIGLWMQPRRPELKLSRSCVASCARSLLMSGGPLRIEPGTVIAFGGMGNTFATVKDQVDAGELFSDDERSQASRERFLATFKVRIEQSLALRELQSQLAPLPDRVRSFLEAAVGGWRITNLSFNEDSFRFGLEGGPQRCLWWLPDAEGLRQLGVDAPGYRPASRADTARMLQVPEQFIYAGPLLDTLPEQPLCSPPPGGTDLPMLP
ncbi:hypothetical protein ACG04R_23850 [Roseateles sp. BYS78W]|uniref:Uncharacterized protein n=1 Tax=Pelomonas candidula TaxID=3299025 RepID=A0ABW7HIR5_9BURK